MKTRQGKKVMDEHELDKQEQVRKRKRERESGKQQKEQR